MSKKQNDLTMENEKTLVLVESLGIIHREDERFSYSQSFDRFRKKESPMLLQHCRDNVESYREKLNKPDLRLIHLYAILLIRNWLRFRNKKISNSQSNIAVLFFLCTILPEDGHASLGFNLGFKRVK